MTPPAKADILVFNRQDHPQHYQTVLALRTEVFVNEQHVPPEREVDEHEDTATHWLMTDNTGTAIAVARTWQEPAYPNAVKIGRMAVKKSHRGSGAGRILLTHLLETLTQQGYNEAVLDAQVPVIGFYKTLGFTTEGPEFMDAGIAHRRMRKTL